MATRTLAWEGCIFAVGFEIEAAPATPSPSGCLPIEMGVFDHQFHLNKLAGMDETVGTFLLLPCNLREGVPSGQGWIFP